MRRAPGPIHAIAEAELDGRPEHLRETFSVRLDRWWTDLQDGLAGVYSPTRSPNSPAG